MKKYLLSLHLVALSAVAAHAQFAVAPEVGLNLATMSLKQSGAPISTSIKKGVIAGALIEYGFNDHLFLQSGAYYAANGCDVTNVGSLSVKTIQVPLNVTYKLGSDGETRFFFGAGPYLGYNISGKSESNGSTNKLKIGDKITDNIKTLDWGLGINVGVLLSNDFFIHIRYQSGIANLGPSGSTYSTTRTSAIQITLGLYLWHSGSKKEKEKESDKNKTRR